MVNNGSDVQIDKGGFVRIHYAILEQLAIGDFSSREYACILHLLRMTYGFNRKECTLSYGDFAGATNIDRTAAIKTLRSLVARNIVIKVDGDAYHAATWSFNKYFEQWQTSVKTTTSVETTTSQIDTTPSVETTTSLVVETTTSYISAKDNIKDIPTDSTPGGYFGMPDPRQRKGATITGQAAEARKLGVEPTAFREMTDALIDAAGWRAVVDAAGDDVKLGIAKDNALALVKMGHTTGEQVAALAIAFRAANAWRNTPPQPRDLVTYASQVKQGIDFTAQPTTNGRGETPQRWMFRTGGDE